MLPDVAQLYALATCIVERFQPMGPSIVDDGDALLELLAKLAARFASVDVDELSSSERKLLVDVLERVNCVAQIFFFYDELGREESRARTLH